MAPTSRRHSVTSRDPSRAAPPRPVRPRPRAAVSPRRTARPRRRSPTASSRRARMCPRSRPARSNGSHTSLRRQRQHGLVRVLGVDDEPQLRRALERALKLEGYDVELAANGEEALGSIASRPADAIVLDVLMPKRDGLEVARELRARGNRTPILMLTARDAVQDRVDGLDAGADDYVVKPFALEELMARLRALLRRTNGEAGERLEYADLTLDPRTREVHRGERPVQLTKTEFALLEHLMRHPRLVLTRSQLFEAVWGYDFGPRSNSLEVYIGYLRRKTEEGGEPRLIQTVRGVGYSLRST